MRESTTHELVGVSYRRISIVSDGYADDDEDDARLEGDTLVVVGRTCAHILTGDRDGGVHLTITTHSAAPELAGEWERTQEVQADFGGELGVYTPTGPWGLFVDTDSPGPLKIRVAATGWAQNSAEQQTILVQIWDA